MFHLEKVSHYEVFLGLPEQLTSGSHIAQVGLEFLILLPPYSQCCQAQLWSTKQQESVVWTFQRPQVQNQDASKVSSFLFIDFLVSETVSVTLYSQGWHGTSYVVLVASSLWPLCLCLQVLRRWGTGSHCWAQDHLLLSCDVHPSLRLPQACWSPSDTPMLHPAPSIPTHFALPFLLHSILPSFFLSLPFIFRKHF